MFLETSTRLKENISFILYNQIIEKVFAVSLTHKLKEKEIYEKDLSSRYNF